MQAVNYGCFEAICRQQDQRKFIGCSSVHIVLLFKKCFLKKISEKSFNFRSLGSFNFRNAKVTKIHTSFFREITGEKLQKSSFTKGCKCYC